MENYLDYIVYGVAGLGLLLSLIGNIRLSGIIKKYKKLIIGLSNENTVYLMIEYFRVLDALKKNLKGNIETRVETLENKMESCLKNVGIECYNAFKDVGNNMSFSIAALNDRKNGFVLTGIYTRENSYVYTKRIESGKPDKELSQEEQSALYKALSKIK